MTSSCFVTANRAQCDRDGVRTGTLQQRRRDRKSSQAAFGFVGQSVKSLKLQNSYKQHLNG